MDHYLLFVAHAYAYSIMRPLQAEIRRRGAEAVWWVEPGCPDLLRGGERRLRTLSAVRKWAPRACFAAGNWIYDFFPGVKVYVFHGFAIDKRGDANADDFKMRGWFDIYCTQSALRTEPLRRLAEREGCFCVYETGWPKTDTYVRCREKLRAQQTQTAQKENEAQPAHVPTVMVASTFTKRISALDALFPHIERMAATRPWRWLITMHPKLYANEPLRRRYEALAARLENVRFQPVIEEADDMAATDVLLCDASSIIVEYMLLGKPVVTLRNTQPGPHLIDVRESERVEQALEQALTPQPALLAAAEAYVETMEAHRDGHNAERVVAAIDDFIAHRRHRLPRRRRPNFFRRLKIRWHFLTACLLAPKG